VNEKDWLDRQWAQTMLSHLRRTEKVTRTKDGKRRLRLFACACCRVVWKHLHEPQWRNAVEVAERFADGQADKEELEAARRALNDLHRGKRLVQEWSAVRMAAATTDEKASSAAVLVTAHPHAFDERDHPDGPGAPVMSGMIRCIFGNPFRPSSIERSWLAWNDGLIPRLAEAIYAERAFDRLPILADALEEAGCTDQAIFAHCRNPGLHARGCWVVDALRG
jgi:hypothetical protein